MELIVTLKQHTPIIHFQWEQTGATLRATELKPKLDRYIDNLKSYYKEDMLKQIVILNNTNETYRLTISQPPIKEKIIPKILDKKTKKSGEYDLVEPINSKPNANQRLKRSLYFGDIKAMLEYSDDVTLRFQSFSESVLKKIYLALPIMLAMENFGSRQNKGFGSFYINDFIKMPDGFNNLCKIAFLRVEDIYKNHIPNNVYSFECKGDYIETFKKIFYFYNALKAGTNEGGTYSKSLLWKYLCKKTLPSKHLIWEKRVMKQHLIGDTLPSPLTSDYQFIRVLLGLSPIYEFKSPFYSVRMDTDYSDSRALSIPNKVSFSVEDAQSDKKQKIERTISPLTFKPIKTNSGYRIYIILKPELITGVTNHKFLFKEIGKGLTFEMKPPASFDLNAFMDFALKEMSNSRVNKFVNGLKVNKIK
jgi:hypothetical protein